jgi:protein FAM50
LYQFKYCVAGFREEELQMQKRKKRRVRGDPRLSFFDEIENGSDDDEFENRMIP